MSRNLRTVVVFAALVTLALALVVVGQSMADDAALTPVQELGKFLYFDENLSEPAGQSCASCHHPDFGFADPDRGQPVSEGVIPGLFGGRNSPSAAYAQYAPVRYFDEDEGLWIGGAFWDSRATGEDLGDPLADQALGPFKNPVEMANLTEFTVVRDALQNDVYGDLFDQICGPVDLTENGSVLDAYDCIALSIAAFERTEDFGQFTSKYDHYLQACLAAGGDPTDCAVGEGSVAVDIGPKFFTKKEWHGFQLFMDEEDGGAKCVLCHVADWTVAADYELPVVMPQWTVGTAAEGMIPPVFTDFTYDNLGVPKSDDKLLAGAPVDLGLGAIVGDPEENGKFKVMTLRNVHVTGPYAHNGFFKQLEDITHFYNTRDVEAEGWAAPEYPGTVNTDELGDLGLSGKDEEALVKFMKTLTDGWIP